MEQHEHCSDEALLRHLDGESAPHEQRAVIQHLKACWVCRASLAELEGQIHALARSQREASFPGPGWPAEARWKFSAWRDRYEEFSIQVPSFAAAPPVRKPFPAAVLCTACAAVVALVAWLGLRPGPRPEVRELLARAVSAEAAVYRQPVHQDFRVTIADFQSGLQPWRGRLEIWSDPGHKRLSAKLTNSNGAIRHGVWRVRPGEEYVYNPQASRHPGRHQPEKAALDSAWGFAYDANELEAGFIRWMDSRQWRPIAVSDAEVLLAGLGGVLVRVQAAANQPDVTTVRAQGADGRFVELTVDTSDGPRRPRVRKIRLAYPPHSAEMVLIADRAESFVGAELRPAIFRPDPAIYASQPSHATASPPLRMHPLVPELEITRTPLPQPSAAALSLAAKIEVYYALHRAKACLGEPVHVMVTDQGITVRGLVETMARKNELLRAIEALPGGIEVAVDIRSVSEMATPLDPLLGPLPGGLQQQGQTLVRSRQLPIRQALRSYFESHAAPARSGERADPGHSDVDHSDLDRRVVRLSNDAVRWSATLLAHCWSLRRLAGALAGDDLRSLTPRSKLLIEDMVSAHLEAMREGVGAEGGRIEDILAFIQGQAPDENAPAALDGGRLTDRLEGPGSLFESVSAVDAIVRMLFAGDDDAAVSRPTQGVEASGFAVAASSGGDADASAGAASLLAAIRQAARRLDGLMQDPLDVVLQRNGLQHNDAASTVSATGGMPRPAPTEPGGGTNDR